MDLFIGFFWFCSNYFVTLDYETNVNDWSICNILILIMLYPPDLYNQIDINAIGYCIEIDYTLYLTKFGPGCRCENKTGSNFSYQNTCGYIPAIQVLNSHTVSNSRDTNDFIPELLFSTIEHRNMLVRKGWLGAHAPMQNAAMRYHNFLVDGL